MVSSSKIHYSRPVVPTNTVLLERFSAGDEAISVMNKEGNEILESQVLSALPNPLFVIDSENRFVYSNQAAEMFFRSSQLILSSMRLTDFISLDSTFFLMVLRARDQQLTVVDQGLQIFSPKIGLKLLNVQIAPFGDTPQNLIISVQERGLAERLRGQSIFRGAARSVSAMAALLAHEIKNPLAGIKGAAQLLHSNQVGEDQSLTSMIVQEADRVTALLDRMEGFTGGECISFGPVNIHEVLDHCLNLASASYGAHLTIKRQYDPSLPAVHGHKDLLIQAFINIIKNASEATEDKSKLIIKTSYSRGRHLSKNEFDSRSHVPVQVDVIDSGQGIPDEIRDHIFDPFVSGKVGGTGLGLTMVASVVADHRGMIEVDSLPGQTNFRFNFPVSSMIGHDLPNDDRGLS